MSSHIEAQIRQALTSLVVRLDNCQRKLDLWVREPDVRWGPGEIHKDWLVPLGRWTFVDERQSVTE